MAALTALLLGAEPGQPPVPEAELLSRFLGHPTTTATLRSLRATADARSAGAAVLPNPELSYRHEEARGSAGARTDAVTANITIDLGFVGAARTAAGALRADATPYALRLAISELVCSFRESVLDAATAEAELASVRTAHERLTRLGDQLDALVQAGESAGYDRDRVALARSAHRLDLLEFEADAARLLGRLAALTGGPFDALTLEPLAPLPTLDDALAAAGSDHPRLRLAALEQRAARRDADAASREVAPDLSIQGGGRWDAPPEGGRATPGFEVGATVELPLFDHNRRAIREAEAEEEAWRAEVARAAGELEAEVRAAWGAAAALGEPTPLPADPDRVWAAALQRYAGAEASVDDLLQVARDLEQAERAQARSVDARRSAHLALACALANFDEPNLHSAIDEAIR